MILPVVLAIAGACGAPAPRETGPASGDPAATVAGDAGLERHELPGFSIALPPGTMSRDSVEYRRGRVTYVDQARALGFMIGWDLGMVGEAAEAVMLDGLSISLGLDRRIEVTERPPWRVGDLPARSLVVRDTIITLVQCGVRMVGISSRSYGGAAPRLAHRRVIESFRCAPDPAQEQVRLAPPPVVLDLPAGWKQLASEGEERAWDNELHLVTAQWAAEGTTREVIAVASAIFAEQGTSQLAPAASIAGMDAVEGTFTRDDGAFAFVAVILTCEERPATVFFYGDTIARGRELLATARCEAVVPASAEPGR